MKSQSSERGQVLVIIILVIVALMGFAALAVDGGRVYAERRRAQNAADAAAYKIAYTAANFPATSEAELLAMAYDKVEENGFVMDLSLAPEERPLQIDYHHPPTSGVYAGNLEYYQVFITTDVGQGFSHFVYSGTQTLTVEAVAKARPSASVSPGDALYANSENADPALWFAGTGDTTITGGDAFSNSKAEVSGKQNGDGSITVQEPHNIEVAGNFVKVGGSGDVSPDPLDKYDGIKQQQLPPVPVPDCITDMTGQSVGKKAGVLSPGRYTGAVKITTGDWVMEPGMYCFMDGFSFNGGSLTGTNVFIAVMGGDLKITGGGNLTLKRPNDLRDGAGNPNGNGNQWGGMLFYVASGDVEIEGGAAVSYTGTIYAPNSHCSIGGNSGSVGLNASVICDTVKIHGTANVSINYKEPENYRLPPMIELSQ